MRVETKNNTEKLLKKQSREQARDSTKIKLKRPILLLKLIDMKTRWSGRCRIFLSPRSTPHRFVFRNDSSFVSARCFCLFIFFSSPVMLDVARKTTLDRVWAIKRLSKIKFSSINGAYRLSFNVYLGHKWTRRMGKQSEKLFPYRTVSLSFLSWFW